MSFQLIMKVEHRVIFHYLIKHFLYQSLSDCTVNQHHQMGIFPYTAYYHF